MWMVFVAFLLWATHSAVEGLRQKRVVRGHPQPRESAAALVALESRFDREGTHLCGGTLIAPRVILTAAHCVYHEGKQRFPLTVKVTLNAYYRGVEGMEVLTNHVIIHPNYIESSFDPSMDVAVVLLPFDIPVCANVYSPQVARLPPPTLRQKKLFNSKCFLLGWGKTEAKNESDIPLRADVINMRVEFSQDKWSTVLRADASGNNRACFGDSGGPVVCELYGLPYLVGVSSEIGGSSRDSSVESSKSHSAESSESHYRLPYFSHLRCLRANLLTAFNAIEYMPAVLDMLREFGLEESVRQSQDFCFGQFHSL